MSSDGLKRPFESGDDGQTGVLKKQRGEGPHIEFRALIPSKVAGSVIGRGGTTIKHLRQDFRANVNVPDSTGPERVLTLGANVGTVCEILLEILPLLADINQGIDPELRFLIHQSQAGAIIGKAGSKIKELRQDYGVNIKVYSQPAPQSTERCVSVAGKPNDVVNCIAGMYDLLMEAPPKGFTQPYDPQNYNDFHAHDYGGYSSGEIGGDRGMLAMPRQMMRGGPPMRGIPPRGSGRSGMGPMGRGAMGGMGDLGGGYSLDAGGPPDLMIGSLDTQSTQVSIPKDLAGAIIGKGGMRISQIRQNSGATINIAEPVPGSTDRIITITGSQEQIQNAQYLLQMSVKQFSGKY